MKKHNKNFTTEIEESMCELLTPQFIKKKASNNNVLEAVDNLVKAAEAFENLKMFAVAEVVTNILEGIPKKVEK